MNEVEEKKTLAEKPLWVLVLHAAGIVESRVEAILGESGLSVAKFAVLHQLIQAGEALPLSRLAERLSCVKSNMTQAIDRLEVEGLVTRVDDPQDRRTVLADITNDGRRRYGAASGALSESEEQLLGGLNALDRKQFAELLLRLNGG